MSENNQFIDRHSRLRSISTLRHAFLFCLILGLGGTLVVWDAVQGQVRSVATLEFFRLSGSALILTLVGWSLARLAGWERIQQNAALLLGVSQVLAVAWLYLRSTINGISGSYQIPAWPVSGFELYGLALLLTALGVGKQGLVRSVRELKGLIPSMIWVLVALFIVVQRELPRDLMLSSDPDQHQFWAHQLLKLGSIPRDLGDWGPLDFQYPAGFAALCALWSWLSGTSAGNSVTLQPLLQSVLAVLALAGLSGEICRKAPFRHQAVMVFAGLAVFFGFFPFSLLKEFYSQSKTGSISTLLLFVTVVALSLLQMRGRGRFRAELGWYVGALGLGWSALINPVAVITPGIFFYACLAWRFYKSGDSNAKRDVLGLLLLAVVPLVLIFLDPYYSARFFAQRSTGPLETPPDVVIQQLSFAHEVSQYLRNLLVRGEFVRPLLLLQYFAHPVLAIGCIAALVLSLVFLSNKADRSAWLAWFVGAPVLCVLLQILFLPVFYALRNKGDLYLLEPYFLEAINRLAYLWLMSVLLTALALGIKCFSNGSLRSIAGLSAAVLLLFPLHSVRDRLPSQLDLDFRQSHCSLKSCDTRDDAIVLASLNAIYEQEAAAKSKLVPPGPMSRVLVPNQVRDIWRERWLLPVGTARNLPANTSFPLAFYYYKGDPEFSYRNYVERVCENFDVEWLKQHRIKYIYLPSDRDKACVSGVEGLLASDQLVVKSGKAAMIRIY
ncbi:hypothetical protein [Paucibacter sp. Y2R2-4]|uniref:hypothetical protein n=1 Tax=Paucibacter sp. Y2R2-4 TaxID=2893553 RepID=UPI0021E4AF17|nr:hypothetical protein [Paucibacter sp. Y2R2-4]MCV2351396.1 hypothetical protein [Paucibacter sp. Y2R2-4]